MLVVEVVQITLVHLLLKLLVLLAAVMEVVYLFLTQIVELMHKPIQDRAVALEQVMVALAVMVHLAL